MFSLELEDEDEDSVLASSFTLALSLTSGAGADGADDVDAFAADKAHDLGVGVALPLEQGDGPGERRPSNVGADVDASVDEPYSPDALREPAGEFVLRGI